MLTGFTPPFTPRGLASLVTPPPWHYVGCSSRLRHSRRRNQGHCSRRGAGGQHGLLEGVRRPGEAGDATGTPRHPHLHGRATRPGQVRRKDICRELNQFLTGWAAYFAYDPSFRIVDLHAAARARNFLRRRQKLASAARFDSSRCTLGAETPAPTRRAYSSGSCLREVLA